MSDLHPIIAVTGSSGAGTTTVKTAFEHIVELEGLVPAIIEGDSYHRYNRSEMEWEVEKAALHGKTLTHFGPEGNLFDELESLFANYAKHGTGKARHYVHTEAEERRYHSPPGTFTEWTPLPDDTDLLFYEGLHGGLVTEDIDIARYVDLLIGVVPIINLEWMQKIHRDRAVRGYSAEAATDMILRRMSDYVHYICPQFSRTDINFQRVPTIDTSNPFVPEDIPSMDESLVVIHIANRSKIKPDFRGLCERLEGAFMSRADTIVVPGRQMGAAMRFLLTPVVRRLIERRDKARVTAVA
jgi:phosphoribulokinase